MIRSSFTLAILLAASVLSVPSSARERGEARQPNIVFFLADDLGWTDLGCYGSTFYETPNLDRIAAEGMRFTDAYAACQVCSPTRASILSGKYPARLDTTDYFGGARRGKLLPAPYHRQLPLEEVTLAEALRDAGYKTLFLGKWHLGSAPFLPEAQGFDVNVAGHGAGMPASYFAPYRRKNRSYFDVPGLEGAAEGEYLTDRLTSEALRLIDRHRDEPFLLYLSFYSVHTPLQSKPEYAAKYRKKAAKVRSSSLAKFVPEGRREARQVQDHAVYAGMVQSLDENVGRVLTRLDDLGLADKTAVFFTSDNGGLSTSEGSPTANVPLRAGKGWIYEGGIREPLLVRWPGTIRAGSVSPVPVTSTDYYPTILDLAGLPPRPDQHVDGRSFAGVLRGGEAVEPRALFWHYPHYGNQGGSPSGAVRLGDYKLIEFFETGRAELYNLRYDIGESRDLAANQPARAREMLDLLRNWRKSVDAKMPTPNPEYRPPVPRVLLIGDSIAQGYAPGVKTLLKGKADVHTIPMNGGATSRGLERLEAWVGNGEWDAIHFNWGLHDLCYRRDGAPAYGNRDKQSGVLTTTLLEYERNLSTLAARLSSTGAKLIWATTTPVPEGEAGRFHGDAARYNAVAQRVMDRFGIPTNDLYSLVLPRLGELQKKSDVHFTGDGSRVLARAVAEALANGLGLELDPTPTSSAAK